MTTLSELSGRLDTAETNIVELNQQILLRPDLEAFSAFRTVWNTEHDAIDNTVNNLKARVQTLESLYVNLNTTVSDNFATFTGHTGDSNLHTRYKSQTVSGNTTLATTDDLTLVNATGSSILITFPSVTTASGLVYNIKKIDPSSNVVTLTGGATFDGSLTATLTSQYQTLTVTSDGSAWYLL